MTPRFFCPTPLEVCAHFELPDAVAHHATRVLRLREGDDLVLFDGRGGDYAARIQTIGRTVMVRIDAHHAVERESPVAVTLVQALPAGDKMDWVVQKAVELGVSSIVPLAAERSVLRLSGERAVKRVAHWQQVAVAACEQSGRNHVPLVRPIVSLAEVLSDPTPMLRLILAPGAGVRVRELDLGARSVMLLVGPEGGWTAHELSAAAARQVALLNLGPRVLRTETAGLAALAAIAACWGDG